MRNIPLRLLVAFSLALLCVGKISAQIVMTVDWSNQAAVKFTATSNFSAIGYPGATNFKFSDGIALLNFFSSPVNVVDLDVGSPTPTSNLTDNANVVSSTTKFDRISSWNDSNPSFYPNAGNGSDLTLWNTSTPTVMTFSTSGPAFYGEAIFNLTGYSGFTNLFPALNATGNVVIWNGNGTLGTWQVVGAAAIPEPSTYAALAGLGALGLAMMRRRRAA